MTFENQIKVFNIYSNILKGTRKDYIQIIPFQYRDIETSDSIVYCLGQVTPSLVLMFPHV